MIKNFFAYFSLRQKEEVKSIVFTFLSVLSASFVSIAYNDLMKLTEGIALDAILASLIVAFTRSFWTALFYSIWPNQFKFRVTGKK